MSGSDKSGGDWGEASESLFRASRADHDATPRDRMRVAEALARRLEAAGPPSTGGATGVSHVSRRAGGLVSASGGLKVALGVVLTVGTIALIQQGGGSPERTEHKQLEAPPSAPRDAMAEVRAASSGPEEISARSPTQRVQSAQADRAEGTSVRRHVARASRTADKGKGQSLESVRPRSAAATLRPDAFEEIAQADLGQSPHADASADSPASGPSRRAAHDSPAAAPEAPARALPAIAATTDDETAARDSRAEIAWFERIQTALRTGQTSTALALCNEHEKRWPQGVFAVEREGVRALAGCVLRTSDANARARAFLEAYPRTPMGPRVVAACGQQQSEQRTRPLD